MRRPHSLLGKSAPSFSLPNFNGENFTFTPGSTGRPAALFFYPKSGAFVSTREACQFRDYSLEKDLFKTSGIQIIGISPDSVEKQKDFVEKQHLNYPVLSDTRGDARRAYEVHKGLLGLNESSRLTFFVDSSGVVREVFNTPLNVGNHAKFIYRCLARLAGEPMTDEMMSEAMTDDMSVTGMLNNEIGMEEAMSGMSDNTTSTGDMHRVDSNNIRGLPTYASTVEQGIIPNSNVQVSSTPIFVRMMADRMSTHSIMAANSPGSVTVDNMSPMVSQTIMTAHEDGPPENHTLMSESMSTKSDMDMMTSFATVPNSPLTRPISAIHVSMSSTKDSSNMHNRLNQISNSTFPSPTMDTHIIHSNNMPMSDNRDRQERISLGDTSVTDIHPTAAVSRVQDMSITHNHTGCDCTCHSNGNMFSKITNMEAPSALTGTVMHSVVSDIDSTSLANTLGSMTKSEKTVSNPQPFSAVHDTMALSIIAALNIKEKEPLQGKAAAHAATLQSLLAIYGRTENQEPIDPVVTDPMALSILSAALGYYRS